MDKSLVYHQIFSLAESQIGKPYLRAWKDLEGFDCSGFILWLFSQMGIEFAVRFRTVEFFADAKQISLDQVQPGDLMFRHEEPQKSEHNFVHHIELVAQKPFQQEGKWKVKTIGSSRNKLGFDQTNHSLEIEGVAYRIREIDERKSFGRVSYFDQILDYQKTWDPQHLQVQKPQEVKTKREL